MDEYAHLLTREELISLVRDLKARQECGLHAEDSDSPRFPVFGKREQREFEMSPWPIRIFDRQTLKYVAANDAALALYGYTREEFLRLTPIDTRHPDEVDDFYSTLSEPSGYLRHRPPRRHVKKSGEIAIVEIVTQDILYNGRESRLSLTMDVTERVRMHDRLRRREREFSALVEHAPDIIARFDRELRYVYVNPAVGTAMGIPRNVFIGKTSREIGVPDALETVWDRELRRVFESCEERSVEIECPCHDGVRHFEARIVPESGPDGEVETVLAVARDITERKRAEMELRRQKKLLEVVFDNLPVGVFIKDAKTLRYLMRNRFSAERFGYPVASSVGKTDYDLYPQDAAEFYRSKDREALETGRLVEIPEQEVIGRDGDRHFQHVRKVPLFDEKREPWVIVGITDDITERKQNEIAMQRSAQMSRLLESLARAANEAITLEAAMATCLELISKHGGWALGRVALFGEGGLKNGLPRSIWHVPDRDRFAEFIRCTNGWRHGRCGPFLYRVLREQTTVWIEDVQREPEFGRRDLAIKHGLRSAFAFPIIARGEVVAVIEVFDEEARSEDPQIVGAAQTIASQLARIIERGWAQESTARLAAIVESSQDAIISRALNGTILTWNPAAERLFGYTAEEAVGRDISLIIPPEEQQAVAKRRALLERGVTIPVFETVRQARDGRRIPVSLSVSSIADDTGRTILGASTIIRDITQRKQAEQALRESEERLELAIESAGLGMWDWNVRTGETRRHRRWYELLGYAPQDVPDRMSAWRELIHPDDWPEVQRRIDDYFRGTMALYTIEYRMKSGNGRWLWMQSIGSAVERDSDGRPSRMIGLIQDLTERKLAEEERLSRTIRQRDALVREVHHRIKNHLQGLAGLLRQTALDHPAVAALLETVVAQMKSVALVYGLQNGVDPAVPLVRILAAICELLEGLTPCRIVRRWDTRQAGSLQLAPDEAVPVAVALNELVFNAIKHCERDAGMATIEVEYSERGEKAQMHITNRGALPLGFDYATGAGCATGLELVKTLLGPKGNALAIWTRGATVETALTLGAPLVAAQPLQTAA